MSACTNIAGGRRPNPLEAVVVAALTIGMMFNPIIYVEGMHHFIMVPDEKNEYRKQYLGSSLEGHRFALGCECAQGHCFYETLNNFSDRGDKLCRFCSTANGMWEAANKEAIPECELQFMAMLQSARIDQQVACQANLGFWPGRIDFYHMPSKTAMQVDGNSHFTVAHHKHPHDQLINDLRCCRKAWLGRGRLLRVHGDHGNMKTTALAAIQLPYSRFVMVTRVYETIPITWIGITRSYVD